MAEPPIIYPTLFYNDGLAAMAWLERAFGFQPLMSVPGEDGSLVHGEMHFRGAIFFLSAARPAQGYYAPRKRGELECAISIGVTDPAEVDAIYERARAGGRKSYSIRIQPITWNAASIASTLKAITGALAPIGPLWRRIDGHGYHLPLRQPV